MRSRWLILGSLVTLLSVTAVVGVRAQGGATLPGTPPARQQQVREQHPELRRALRALENARGFLQNAARDFGGHRTRAQDLTVQAIKEVQAAIEYDKR